MAEVSQLSPIQRVFAQQRASVEQTQSPAQKAAAKEGKKTAETATRIGAQYKGSELFFNYTQGRSDINGRQEKGRNPEMVELPEDVLDNVVDQMDWYITGLKDMMEPEAGVFNMITSDVRGLDQNGSLVAAKQLVETYTTVTRDQDGNIINRSVDKAKIKAAAKTKQGLQSFYVQIDELVSKYAYLQGIVTDTGPNRVQQQAGGHGPDATIRLGVNQGFLNKLFKDKLSVALSKRNQGGRGDTRGQRLFQSAAVVAINVMGSSLAGVPMGMLGLNAAAMLGSSLTNEGLRIERRACAEALQSIQRDPTELQFLNALTGMRIDEFRVNGDRIESTEANPRNRHNQSIEKVEKKFLDLMYTRIELLAGVGVPPDQIDALPDEPVYRGLEQTHTDLKIDRYVETRYERLLDEFRQNHPPAGPGQYPDTMADRLQLRSKARREIIAEQTQRLVELNPALQQDTSEITLGKKNQLEAKRTRLRSEEELNRVTAVAVREKARLTKEREPLAAEQTAIQQAEQTIKTKEADLENIINSLRTNEGIIFDQLPTPAEITTTGTPLQDAIDQIHDRLHNPDPAIGLLAEIANRRSAYNTELGRLRRDAINALPRNATQADRAEARDEATKEMNETPDGARFMQLLKEAQEAEQREIALKQIQDNYRNAYKEFTDAEKTAIEKSPKNLTETYSRYRVIIDRNGTPRGPLTRDDLLNESVDRLYDIARNSPGNPYGWAALSPEARRERLFQAKVEALAQVEEVNNPSPQQQEQDFALANRFLRRNDLLTVNTRILRANLVTELTNRGLPTTDVDRVLDNAIIEARKKLRIRRTIAIKEQLEQNDTQIERQNNIITNGKEALERQAVQIDTVINLMDKAPEVRNNLVAAFNNREKRANITNPVPVNEAPDGGDFTQAERALTYDVYVQGQRRPRALPQGYLYMLQEITGWQQQNDREKALKDAREAFPPHILAQLLVRSLIPEYANRPWSNDITAVLAAINSENRPPIAANPAAGRPGRNRFRVYPQTAVGYRIGGTNINKLALDIIKGRRDQLIAA